MKYIDAEKLKEEIRNREAEQAELIKSTDELTRITACAKIGELEWLIGIINTLKQEHSGLLSN